MTTEPTPPPPPEPPPSAAPAYPVLLDFRRPDRQRVLTNLPIIGTAIRTILVYPSLIILALLYYAALLGYFASTFVILFRGRYPRGLFKLLVGALRWQANVTAYTYHLYDDYPPLDLDQREGWWLNFQVDYPEGPNRLLNSPFLGILIKAVLLIPHVVVVYALSLLALVAILISTVAITFTRSYPAGLHRFVCGVLRWQYRVYAYLFGLTDHYPPFSLG